MPLMSMREYAKHRGVSHTAVQKAVKTGRITRRKDGKIDSKRADRQWDSSTDVSKPRNSVTGKPKHRRPKDGPPRPEGSGAAGRSNGNGADEDGGGGSGYVAARTVREHYLARKAKLDYEQAVGKLLDADEIRRAMYKAGRVSRDLVLTLPSRLAPILAAEIDEAKCLDILEAEVQAVCEDISRALTLEEEGNSS